MKQIYEIPSFKLRSQHPNTEEWHAYKIKLLTVLKFMIQYETALSKPLTRLYRYTNRNIREEMKQYISIRSYLNQRISAKHKHSIYL